jgi:hypothetical protein
LSIASRCRSSCVTMSSRLVTSFSRYIVSPPSSGAR